MVRPKQLMARVPATACLTMIMLILEGCSLPGWQLQTPDQSRSHWYGQSTQRQQPPPEPEKDYEPVVKKITPSLIQKLQKNQSAVRGKNRSLPKTPDQHREYRIGPGDVLSIIVYGHQDLTNPAGTTQSVESSGRLVDSDGEIYMPYIGTMDVAGLTADAVRREATKGLSDVIRDPQVDVRILKYRSQKVYITGDISQPCSVPIRDIRLTVVDALNSCRSLISENDPGTTGINAVQLIRDDRVYPLNLSRLYRQGGDPIGLKDGDRLVVDDSFNRIFLIGEFDQQTTTAFSAGGMSLTDAIASAGGLNLSTADASNIYVIRGFVDKDSGQTTGVETRKQPLVYHLDAGSVDALLLADRFELQPRDIVYAAPASLVNFNRALAQIMPSLNVLFQSALIYDRANDD